MKSLVRVGVILCGVLFASQSFAADYNTSYGALEARDNRGNADNTGNNGYGYNDNSYINREAAGDRRDFMQGRSGNWGRGYGYASNYDGGNYVSGGNYASGGSCGAGGCCAAPAVAEASSDCCAPQCPPEHAVGDCTCLYCRYEPCYYNCYRCVEEPYTVQRKCCRYVDQCYTVQKCRYVPQYYCVTCTRKVPQYYCVPECRTCKKWICEQKCRFVPKYYYKRVCNPECCAPSAAAQY